MSIYVFFQAEDGIRDRNVTGVQTCALPIWVERQAGESAEAAARTALAFGAERAGGVFEHRDTPRKLLDPRWATEEIDGHDRLCPWAGLELLRVEVHRLGVDVD